MSELANYFFAFVISLITAVIATPVVMKLAFKIGAIDKPNARKVHQRIMPRLGGLAIFLSGLQQDILQADCITNK
ncbi:hypothetical protein GCM10020331_026670 [Ectobacillus funiculus]